MDRRNPDLLHVKKCVRRFRPKGYGTTFSFNEWEVRRGVKLVARFERRCDAYAYLRELQADASVRTGRKAVAA